jgi:hypothetical protein
MPNSPETGEWDMVLLLSSNKLPMFSSQRIHRLVSSHLCNSNNLYMVSLLLSSNNRLPMVSSHPLNSNNLPTVSLLLLSHS